jgi:hypothetical protein
MKSHSFKPSEFFGNKLTFEVYCKRTTGRFNTKIWIVGKESNQVCPCCKERIKRDKK